MFQFKKYMNLKIFIQNDINLCILMKIFYQMLLTIILELKISLIQNELMILTILNNDILNM